MCNKPFIGQQKCTWIYLKKTHSWIWCQKQKLHHSLTFNNVCKIEVIIIKRNIIPGSSSLYFNTQEIISVKFKIISLVSNYFFSAKRNSRYCTGWSMGLLVVVFMSSWAAVYSTGTLTDNCFTEMSTTTGLWSEL